jgi:8-oxo-dGTP pyrophosphatase MutT (NUDIX family)
MVKQKLKRFLSQRQKLHNLDAGLIPSAVLIPIFYKRGEYHVLFTRRTENVKSHKGQISFPGGSFEEADGTLLNTALRESAEEIGLAAEDIEVLGELDDTLTLGTDYNISPFLAAIAWPYRFNPDPVEVAEIIEIPITALLDEACVTQRTDIRRSRPMTGYSYDYQGEIIWGATARILHQFLEIWVALKINESGIQSA